jgi:hypothetical protein
MKHVTTSANDSISNEDSTTDNDNDLHSKVTPIPTIMTTLNSTIKADNKKIQERCYGVFVQIAKNSSFMIKNFEKLNALLGRVDGQMNRFIEKLWSYSSFESETLW